MKKRTLADLEEYYKIDFEKAIGTIKSEKAKLVLVQFPDGLKPYATAIVDLLRKKTNAEFLIYLGSCFGACDTPIDTEKLGVDLIIQFGHNELMPSYLKN